MTAVGYTYRRSPAVEQIRRELAAGTIGELVHFNGHYWCDYALDPTSPITWRYRGGPGTGALADVGSHLIDLSEFVCGPITEVGGAAFATLIRERPVPLGVTYGHTKGAVSDEMAPVENEDVATFTATFANGAVGTFSASRVAHSLPDGLGFELFASTGSAAWNLHRPGEFEISTAEGRAETRRSATRDHRTRPPVYPRRPTDGRRRRRARCRGPVRATRPAPSSTRSPASASWGHCPNSRPVCTACASWPPSPSPPSRVASPSKSSEPRRSRRTMKLGVYTAILHDKPLREALEVIASLGLTGAEINAGGFLPTPHLPVEELLSGEVTPQRYLSTFDGTGVSIAGLNCNGNPLHPDPEVGPEDAEDLRNAIRVAGLLGVDRVVTMSGLPQAHPGGQWPAWHVNTWDSGYLDSLDYQWDDIAVPFWTEIDAFARENGVKVAIEMHPQNLVFNPPTMKRLVDKTGATHVGAEMDPSHLFWQGIDPVAAIEWLGPLVFHAAAKDTRINDNCKIYGVLDERFTRIPLDQNPTGLGGRHVVNKWPEDSAWDFVAVGRGHDTEFWARFLNALEAVDPDMWVNIEHEDVAFGPLEGLQVAAETLKTANSASVG